jgi:GR25 family glycosyltransferase involved in LPS biosynthesis
MFDRQFIITVPSSKERFDLTMAHLATEGLAPTPFVGISADISGLETKWTYEVDHPGSGYRIGPKHVAMNLSHYMLWKVCSFIEGDSFIIFEDDVRFVVGWRPHFEDAVAHLPSDWDMLYVGSCCCAVNSNAPIHGRLHKTKYALCTHAYAVRKKALLILLEHCQKVWTHIDINIMFGAFPHLNCYAIIPRLADQQDTIIPP